MKLKLILVVIGLLVSPSALAEKQLNSTLGQVGNGGGGIGLPSGKKYTMAQAGLKFYGNKEDPFYVDAVIMKRSKEILQIVRENCSLEFSDSSCEHMAKNLDFELSSNKHIYKKTEVVDPKLFNRLKNEYQKFVDKLPIKGKFVLAAYTEQQTTMLFPDFFESDLETQAIYLIHEAMFSYDPKVTLEKVLRVEVAIVDLLKEITPDTRRAMRDAFSMARNLSAEKADNEQVGNYLEYLYALGKTVELSRLFESSNLDTSYQTLLKKCNFETFYQTSPFALSENKSFDPEFFRMFFGKELRTLCLFRNPSEAFDVQLKDLEFRGVQIFNKKTGKLFGLDIYGADKYFRVGNDPFSGILSFQKIKNDKSSK